MRLSVIGHEITMGNILGQHIGSTDIPLAEEGGKLARKTSAFPDNVSRESFCPGTF